MLTADTVGPPYDQGHNSNLYSSRNKASYQEHQGEPRQSHPIRSVSDGRGPADSYDDYSFSTSHTSADTILMNGLIGTAPQGTMYVRALYDYEADDRTSLSFHEGDVIQVINQLESGWWDGVINGVRGWFPSNYCQIVTSADELPDSILQAAAAEQIEDEVGHGETYVDDFEEEDESDYDGTGGLPLEGAMNGDRSRSDFWIPQATPDGRLFYYNMMTGDRSTELPLESPGSSADSGPRDRSGTNVSIPDRTRPPPEMMARGGMMRDEEESDDTNSASELDGENIIANTRGTLVGL